MRLSIILFAAGATVLAQAPKQPAPTQATPEATARLLQTGHCSEALGRAKRAYSLASDPDLKKRLGAGGVRCSMTLNRTSEAASFIELLNRDFPNDAEVLYLAVHTYSDLSLRASQSLLFAHPESYQVHQLNAEALETQGKWEEAAEEYRVVLSRSPNLPGIHYRLGRILLSKPETPTSREDAKKEFEAELRIDPANAGAEFVLAELARQADNNEEAIQRFTRATQDDAMFADAWLGLGRSLLAAGQPEKAIAPLETAVKLQPDNPAMHFHLAAAYRRSGRKADADRETLAHKQTSERARATADEMKKAVSGTDITSR